MATLLNFIFVFVPGEICKSMLNILISVGLAQWTICCHPNDHLERDDNIRLHFLLIYQSGFELDASVLLNESSRIGCFGRCSHVLRRTPNTEVYYNRGKTDL